MPAGSLDPFARFASDCRLCITAEALYVAPRDVLHPPEESEEPYIVTLTGPVPDVPPLRLVFEVPLASRSEPTMRDVLWWLASDAWAIEHARGTLEDWAADHGYALHEPATTRLFERHAQQAATLARLLGPANYQRLLALFETEAMGPSKRPGGK
jgi:hypothetical protein